MKRIICSTLSLAMLLASLATGTALASSISSGDGGSSSPNTPVVTPEVPKAPSLPSCSLRDTTYSTGQVNITIGSTTDLKLEYVLKNIDSSVQESDWKTADSNEIQIRNEGSYQFYYRVTDEETNLTSVSKQYTIYFDRTSPKAPTFDYENNTNDQCVYVTIKPKYDAGSPIESVYYKINGNSRWYEYKSPIELTTEGEYLIEAYAVDACGNTGPTSKYTVEVDYANLIGIPSVTKTGTSPSNSQISYKIDNYKSHYTYYYQFVKHGAKVNSSNWVEMSRNTAMSISDHGEWDLYIKVEYEKDSVSGKVATCIIDKKAPSISKVSCEKSNNNSTAVNVVIEAEDEFTSKLKYSFDNGKNWQSSNSKTFRSETVLQVCDIQVKDEVGNIAYLTHGINIYKQDNKYYGEVCYTYRTAENFEFNQYARENGYVVGIGNDKFMPDRQITRAELATMLYRVLDLPKTGGSEVSYRDVDKSFWAYEYINEIQRFGLIDCSSRTFEPNKIVTRQEAAYAISQILDLKDKNFTANNFTDSINSKYVESVNAVNELGLMVGYGNGIFGATDALTRAQVVTILNKLIDISSTAITNGKTYTDVPTSHWAYSSIAEASI